MTLETSKLPCPFSNGTDVASFPHWLREHAIRVLARMYSPVDHLFVFRIRKDGPGTVQEGLSPRYTAITLIGLSEEGEDVARGITGGVSPLEILDRMQGEIHKLGNLGDISLILWAAQAWALPDRTNILKRLVDLDPVGGQHPAVELSWALRALCGEGSSDAESIRTQLAIRLKSSFNRHSSLFPHILGDGGGARSHVSCFADLVYPVQALSHYSVLSGDRESLEIAGNCARKFCDKQGEAGQWCWHYDYRTGDVLETYPVYAIHQDAMAPMALFDLREAGGPDFGNALCLGLDWLIAAPELSGATLVDFESDVIWRKVARKEPGKFSRYAQAIASSVHPSVRVPGLDTLFPAGAIDFEDRPYHLGWLLHAWPASRAAQWKIERERL